MNKIAGKVLLSAFAYVAGFVLSGIIGAAIKVRPIDLPAGMDPQRAFLLLAVASPLLMAAMVPLTWGLQGSWVKRWLSIGLVMFVALGVNTVLEALIFSTLLNGHTPLLSLQYLIPCALAAFVLALPIRGEGQPELLPGTFNAVGWTWRLVVAWLSFPAIYWCFGMMVAPIVMHAYQSGIGGLRIPPTMTILETQLLRSALFLVATLPIALRWTKSRRSFIISMGLAYAVSVGIFQLAQAEFIPPLLRIVHAIEITADSFAYAAVVGILLLRAGGRSNPANISSMAATAGLK